MNNINIPDELHPKIKGLGYDKPLNYEDFFEWARDKHSIVSFVSVNVNPWTKEIDNYYYNLYDIKVDKEFVVHSFKTYGEAKKASLLKIVDIVKNK